MDNAYLEELIGEVKAREGGLILSLNGQPEVVVLSIEKYNELLSKSASLEVVEQTEQEYSLFSANQINGQKILVTGGAGYIGAHVSRQLLAAGHKVVVLDNLSTGKRENVPSAIRFVEGDVADLNLLRDLLAAEKFDAVMHLAASIEVEESVRKPVEYLRNNALNTAKLLSAMTEAGIKNLIFSSTAAVYGQQSKQPISETAPLNPDNPYGFSKMIAEQLIQYYCNFTGLKAIVFRYFNAAGCDFDGGIKSTHDSHLIKNVLQVAKGQKPQLMVNGDNYATVDGTCVRDYVHVLDIARAHVKALDHLDQPGSFRVYNIGTSRGASVLEVINAATEVLGKMIPMEIGPRRAGDAPVTVADNAKLKEDFGFELKFSSLETIIQTAWQQIQQE